MIVAGGGYTIAQLVEAACYKPECRSIPDEVIGHFKLT
jgi:hypothetical protein